MIDAASKETLLGASVYASQLGVGTSTNEYGFYSLTLPEGEYELNFSYVGYESRVETIDLNSNLEFTAELNLGNQLTEVVVTAEEATQRHTASKMSSNKISVEKLNSMPVLMGERDVLKLVQLMPGVQSGSEGSTGLYVRGGGPDQNLLLLDGVHIYNVNHLFGFLSTLNGDAIKTAEIIKGGFPARYGGRLSSILDIRMKEGDMEEYHGNASIGLISGKFNLEGPIVKNKSSFHLSARRTWLDAFATPIQKAKNKNATIKQTTAYNFYDLNLKVNHKFSDKSRLFLSSYLGNDLLKFSVDEVNILEDNGLDWGNLVSSIRWNYQISPKLFCNTSVYQSFYDFDLNSKFTDSSNPNQNSVNTSNSDIKDIGAKIDFNYLPTPSHHIRTGLSYISHRFTPTVNRQEGVFNGTPVVVESGNQVEESDEMAVYLEDDLSLGKKVQLNAGLHFSYFSVDRANYNSLQPRAALSYLLSDKSSIKLSYSQMTQFVHLLSSPGLGLPTDLWVPVTEKIKPSNSTQYALGFTQSLPKGFDLTIEGFYKEMENLLEYDTGYNIFSTSQDWEDKVIVGDGLSYGVEVLLEKRIGKTTGWIGYTLSKSERTFPDIKLGDSFPYKYDRRHDVSVAITHKKSERVDFGLIWVYGSGNTYTLGTKNIGTIGAGPGPAFELELAESLGNLNFIENRNNQRLPAYHRLDLSINLHKVKKRGTRTWSFGLYNAYSRQNPFSVTVKKDSGKFYLQQLSLLPIIPFASYSFKF